MKIIVSIILAIRFFTKGPGSNEFMNPISSIYISREERRANVCLLNLYIGERSSTALAQITYLWHPGPLIKPIQQIQSIIFPMSSSLFSSLFLFSTLRLLLPPQVAAPPPVHLISPGVFVQVPHLISLMCVSI